VQQKREELQIPNEEGLREPTLCVYPDRTLTFNTSVLKIQATCSFEIDSRLVVCDSELLNKWFLIFLRNIVPSSSEIKHAKMKLKLNL
jgi:hypothetical protein